MDVQEKDLRQACQEKSLDDKRVVNVRLGNGIQRPQFKGLSDKSEWVTE